MIGNHISIVDNNYSDNLEWTDITVTRFDVATLISWCRKNIDDRDWMFRAGGIFYFRHKQDAITFRLVWS